MESFVWKSRDAVSYLHSSNMYLTWVNWSKTHESKSVVDAWRLPIDIMAMLWFTVSVFNRGDINYRERSYRNNGTRSGTSLLWRSSTSPPAARQTAAHWALHLPFRSPLPARSICRERERGIEMETRDQKDKGDDPWKQKKNLVKNKKAFWGTKAPKQEGKKQRIELKREPKQ